MCRCENIIYVFNLFLFYNFWIALTISFKKGSFNLSFFSEPKFIVNQHEKNMRLYMNHF